MANKTTIEWTAKGKFIQTKISSPSGKVMTIKTEESLWASQDELNNALALGPDKGFKAWVFEDSILIRPLVKVVQVGWEL